ncbi:MAG: carbohydrate binding domain-containing protein [Chloroflexota bacterium]
MFTRLITLCFTLAILTGLLFHLIPVQATGSADTLLIDDFETGLPVGQDENNVPVGYYSWRHPSASISISTTDDLPEPIPDTTDENQALRKRLNVDEGESAGFTHNFTNEAADEWLNQDWQAYDGISFWLYGNNSGNVFFVDILDNRNPGSTEDDAERWSYDIADDFEGWQFFMVPFSEFSRKPSGNGAPDDGFGREEVWGYTVGLFGLVDMSTTNYYLDRVSLYNTTVTPTPTQTQTPTATITPTTTATSTPTSNSTATQTPTAEPTTTATPTPTQTPAPASCVFAQDGRSHCAFLPIQAQPNFRGNSEVEPNNSSTEANGLISPGVYIGTLDSAEDTNDYFAFRLFAPGTVELRLGNIGLGHNYNLILRNESLNVVPGGNSGNPGNADELIGPLTLPSGLYYIQIFNRDQTSSTQSYQLQVILSQ